MSKTPPEIADIVPEGYALEPGSYDEMWDQKDGLRPHWHPFFRAIERMGSKELTRRHGEARLLLRENGVTYNVHGDPDGLHRPWELDSIPLLLQANDWTHQARLTPRSFFNQTCLNSHIAIDPQPAIFREQKDFFGNRTVYFSIEQPHNTLSVTAKSDVHIASQTQLTSDMPWETVRHILKNGPNRLSVHQFVLDSPKVATASELTKYAEPSFSTGRPLIEAVSDLTQRIHNDFDYVPGFTTISTPLSSVLKHRKGVCQDFAHLAIGCLRAMGLAARYISGYLETQPSPNKEHLIGADASHAWFSVYLPNHGWINFDPTNNLLPDDRHITAAWGRDFADVTPLKGVVLGGGQHTLTVSVTVEPIESKFAPS